MKKTARIVGLFTWLLAQTAGACTISHESGVRGFLAESVSKAVAVFLGTVSTGEPTTTNDLRATVEVSRWWEGGAGNHAVELRAPGMMLCGDFLAVGSSYVFFAHDVVDGEFAKISYVAVRPPSPLVTALDALEPRAFLNGRALLALGMSATEVRYLLGFADTVGAQDEHEAWRYAKAYGYPVSCEYFTAWFNEDALQAVTLEHDSFRACERPPIDWSEMPTASATKPVGRPCQALERAGFRGRDTGAALPRRRTNGYGPPLTMYRLGRTSWVASSRSAR
jgi:hypothetical protein